ncbi:MAG: oligosaccharide flippase family protein [Sphaerochaetaceae bacterium]|nr:oligosaccharide flippase family protein [Sphaerochaetaceae bacterium]
MSNTTRVRVTTINALTNYFRFFLTIVISFWLIPFIIRSLGQEIYGLWALSFSIIGFFSLLDFGFGLGVVKWTGEARINGKIEYRNAILSTVLFIYIMLALAGMAVLVLFSLFYGRLFSIPSELVPVAVTILLILGVRSLLIQIPMSLFKGVLFGEQRIYLINIIQILSTVVYASSAYLALEQGLGVVGLASVNCLAFFAENLLYLFFARRKTEKLSLSLKKVKKQYVREALSFSIYSFITTVAGLVLFQTDTLIVQLALNLELVGIYAVAQKIHEYSFLLSKQLVNVLTPLISELKEKQEHGAIRYLLLDLSTYITATGALITFTIYAFGEELLTYWVGPQFLDAAVPLFILMTAFLVTIPELIASNVLMMTGDHAFTAKISITSIIVNLGVSLILVRFLGLTGIALGTLISVIINNVIFTLHRASRLYDFPYHYYLTKVYLPVIIPGVVLAGIGFLVKYYFPVHSLWDMMVKSIPGIGIYLILFWIFSVDRAMKQKVRSKLAFRRSRS